MRLSTRARYGMRLMLELALNWGKGPVPLKDIADSQEISKRYMEHIASALLGGGLVKSVRGAEGGYVLAKEPSQIRLREIVETLEGPLVLTECVENPLVCERYKTCAARVLWQRVGNAIQEVLDNMTLEDLLQEQMEMGGRGLMYYI